MKVNRSDRPHEASMTSIEMLTNKVELYFSKHPELNSKIRFYPENSHLPFPSLEQEEVDVILFGNAFKSIMASGLWPAKKIRIWCLSSRFQSFLTKLLPNIEINLINRDELFSSTQERKDINWKSPLSLVYAGRFSAQKNIQSLIWTTYFLQQYNSSCTLHLIGSFDNHYHEHLGRRVIDDYETKIRKLIDSLHWTNAPIFHPKMSALDWTDLPIQNPIAISLSSYFCEDFGVSLAQASQKGWPIICSNFGGHADIKETNIIYTEDIAHSHLPDEVIQQMSSRLANSLLKKNYSYFNLKTLDKTTPTFFPIEDLDTSRRIITNQLGPTATLIALDELSEFADSPQGATCIEEIESALFKQREVVSIVLYDCDQSHLNLEEVRILESILLKIPSGSRIQFISSKNIFYKDQLKKIINSEAIYLVIGDRDQLKFKITETLNDRFGVKVEN